MCRVRAMVGDYVWLFRLLANCYLLIAICQLLLFLRLSASICGKKVFSISAISGKVLPVWLIAICQLLFAN